jgi:hypothetical protein
MLEDYELRFDLPYVSYARVFPKGARLRMIKTCGVKPSLRVVEEAYKIWFLRGGGIGAHWGMSFFESLCNQSVVLHDINNNMLQYQHNLPVSESAISRKYSNHCEYILGDQIIEVESMIGYQERRLYSHFITIEFDGDISLANIDLGGLYAPEGCDCHLETRTHSHYISENGMCTLPTTSFDPDSLFFRCIMLKKAKKLSFEEPYVYKSRRDTHQWYNGNLYEHRGFKYILHHSYGLSADETLLTIITDEYPEEIKLT